MLGKLRVLENVKELVSATSGVDYSEIVFLNLKLFRSKTYFRAIRTSMLGLCDNQKDF